MPELRFPLIRAWSLSMETNYGNVKVAEVLFRHVDFTYGGRTVTMRGAVLIDAAEALRPLGLAVARGRQFLITIRASEEFLWWPVAAHQAAGDYWTIEMVPYVEWLRQCYTDTDEHVLEEIHRDT